MFDSFDAEGPRMSPERTSQIRSALLAEIKRGRSRRGRRVGVAAAAIGVLAVGGTATAWVGVVSPDVPDSGYCSPQATLDQDVWGHNGFGTVDTPDGRRGTVDGLEVCGLLWSRGWVEMPDGSPVDRAAGLPVDAKGVPPLAACVVDGSLVVYPGDDGTCERLGVPKAAPIH